MNITQSSRVIRIFKYLFIGAGIMWLGAIIVALLLTGYVVGIQGKLFDQVDERYVLFLLGIILVGVASFFLSCTSFIFLDLMKESCGKKNFFTILLQIGIRLLFFPLFLLSYIFKPLLAQDKKLTLDQYPEKKQSTFRFIALRIVAFLLLITVIIPVWSSGYFLSGYLVMNQLNLVDDQISLAGTGSMYPTFPKGKGKTYKEQAQEIVSTPGMMRYPSGFNLLGKHFLNHEIERGDIISFANNKTDEITQRDGGEKAGFVKRVIGLPGDTIEIRDGILILNGQKQKEPYIAKPRSTFGGEFLPECKVIEVPENKLFVMGDNRKGSGDSRHELGFISYSDIDHVIPYKKQLGLLDSQWHNTQFDLDDKSKITLNKEKYLSLLNEKRKAVGAQPLQYQSKLESSAKLRGKVILQFDDYSFEATRSGYSMKKAMSEAGYSNIVYGEAPTQGYYEAEELIENQFEFEDSKSFLLDKDFDEIGIAEVEGLVNGCPTQVIVQHVAGYVPPNYSADDIESWRKTLTNLRDIQPGWASLKENTEFYTSHQNDVDRINSIIVQRISIVSTVLSRMESNQWLTPAEESLVDQDKSLFNEQESLATKLNSF